MFTISSTVLRAVLTPRGTWCGSASHVIEPPTALTHATRSLLGNWSLLYEQEFRLYPRFAGTLNESCVWDATTGRSSTNALFGTKTLHGITVAMLTRGEAVGWGKIDKSGDVSLTFT